MHCDTATGGYPLNMVEGGVDKDGTIIYIGRAFHEGCMLPGELTKQQLESIFQVYRHILAKIMPDKNAAYVSKDGLEHPKSEFEVLRTGELVWDWADSGTVPDGGIVAGRTDEGELLYVGRAFHEGSHTPGRVQISHGCIYIPFGGKEIMLHQYEVLCLR